MQNQEQNINKEVSDSYMSPSFSSYATNQLAGIAEQVGRVHYRDQSNAFTRHQNDDSDFEFVAFREAENYEDKVFFDDTLLPLFNSDLVKEHRISGEKDSSAAALGFPIGRMLIGGGEYRRNKSDPASVPSSESSSEADDLERIPVGTYCVWTPNMPQDSQSRCKKSSSTGSSSSKRWKLLDLLRRSNSDGKDSIVFMAWPAKKKANERWSRGKIEASGKLKVKGFSGDGEKKALTAHETLYMRRVDKKRSTFLPYRQDLFGFCTGRLGKIFP